MLPIYYTLVYRMRTITIAALLSAILMLAASCHDSAVPDPVTLQATYAGAAHDFVAAPGLFIYQSAGYSVLQGVDTMAHDSLTVAFIGTNVGAYPVGTGYNSSINLKRGSVHYSSQNNVSHGTIIISKLDPVSMRATGTFSGTLLNAANRADSLVLTDGMINVPYQ